MNIIHIRIYLHYQFDASLFHDNCMNNDCIVNDNFEIKCL